jgi:hypothetical protein
MCTNPIANAERKSKDAVRKSFGSVQLLDDRDVVLVARNRWRLLHLHHVRLRKRRLSIHMLISHRGLGTFDQAYLPCACMKHTDILVWDNMNRICINIANLDKV